VIKGFLILIALFFTGEGISRFFGLFLPGGVIGMVLLAGLLFSRLLEISQVEDAAQFLLDNMSLFFVPAGVGLLVYFDLIASYWLAIFLITVASFLAVMAATGITVQAIVRQRRQDND
jgi:holin-like protein